MYESREMGRSDYIDKISSFNREKEELESKMRQLQNIGANTEKGKTSVEKQNNCSLIDNSKNDYIVDEKYKREYVSDLNKTNYTPVVNHIEKEGKYVQGTNNDATNVVPNHWYTFQMQEMWIILLHGA